MSDSYHPDNSRVSPDKLSDFIRDQLDPELNTALKISAGHRAGTVHCLAEKLNIWYPGLYDASAYD